MSALALLSGFVLILGVLWDAFETIVLPRRVTRRVRLTRLFRRLTWTPWSAVARRLRSGQSDSFLSVYGPLSLILLLAVWAVGLVVGVALLHWGLGTELETPGGQAGFGTALYMSGTTFFTLGLGDVRPATASGRVLTVFEAGMGLGFIALVIAYLPILYQAFSRREVHMSLLDARAGSPPTAMELLRRNARGQEPEALGTFLHEWEEWSAELLESHLSYPILAYFRSQHDRESWLAALTAILDACALVQIGVEGVAKRPAQLTFSMARHAAVDLAQVFLLSSRAPASNRLPAADLARLRQGLAEAGAPLGEGEAADTELAELRGLYEPYVNALAEYLLMPLPGWLPDATARDAWQTSASEPAS